MKRTSRISGKIRPDLLGKIRINIMIRNGRSTAPPVTFNGFLERALEVYCLKLESTREKARKRRRKLAQEKREAKHKAAKEIDDAEYRRVMEEE